MTGLIQIYNGIFGSMSRILGPWLITTGARFVFAATLLFYFWNSAVTKLGEGFFGFLSPSLNAYIQIFPKKTEELGYEIEGFGAFDWLVAVAGTGAEFILPALIVLGLLTRLAAFGMIGFVFVQSIVDVKGHGVAGQDLGAWFDGPSGSLIMDQRLFWVFIFIVLIVKGAGPFSLDRLLKID